ncbi:MAG: oxygenase MpaB family protein [Pseudomonadota bacterium]
MASIAGAARPKAPTARGKHRNPPGPEYTRPWGFRQNPAVAKEIASLDAKVDCQRIAFLLKSYEFPMDMTRSLEIALYHTYGSKSVSQLLDFTQEFDNHGQKRYDDTYLLIAQFMEAGWDNELGDRALRRMNQAHARFTIKNDDYLFVLWTFIDFPVEWMREYGWRAFTPHEEQAWYYFWMQIGQRMCIKDIPDTRSDYNDFISNYEAREMVPNEYSRNVSDATIRIMQGWLPKTFRPAVKPLAACLCRPQFLLAVGYDRPIWPLRVALWSLLKTRRIIKQFVSFDAFPDLVANQSYRTYPDDDYEIENLGPAYYSPLPNQTKNVE